MSEVIDRERRGYIDRQYEKIISRMDRSSIFGQPIDFENPIEVVVAAYYIGKYAGEHLGNLNLPVEIFPT